MTEIAMAMVILGLLAYQAAIIKIQGKGDEIAALAAIIGMIVLFT